MNARGESLRGGIRSGLVTHGRRRPLPGISNTAAHDCLVEQVIESVRRVRYPAVIAERDDIWSARSDPTSDGFDPIKAALLQRRDGNIEESFWLVFLFILFGKNARSGYRLLRDVYGGDARGGRWTWERTSQDVSGFRAWLLAMLEVWKSDGEPRGFGSHRGHERLETIPKVIETYVAWVAAPRTHVQLVAEAVGRRGGAPGPTFDDLYKTMNVYRFGRLAKFDYLAMLGKLGLAAIEAPSTYVLEATGPLKGARLLYSGDKTIASRDRELDAWLVQLGQDLGVGQQVIEDALCNWQKSPTKLRRFRG